METVGYMKTGRHTYEGPGRQEQGDGSEAKEG